ncbi:unnamed protein product [Closterium sp. Naga37s-1]|nr:unnamed protein product [Closterium sp. Naga37s-1]
MVIAGDSWPLPKPAAAASAASGRSPPASALGSVAMKPPVPPAPKPAHSIAGVSALLDPCHVAADAPASLLPVPSAPAAAPDPPAPSAPFAPDVAPPAPVNPAVPTAAADPAVAPPVARVHAAPLVAAAPVAFGGDLALAAVSATIGGPAPAVLPAEAVHSAPAAPRGSRVVRSLPIAAHHDPIRPSRKMSGNPPGVGRSLLSAVHRAGTGTRDGVGEGAGGEVTDVDVVGRLMGRRWCCAAVPAVRGSPPCGRGSGGDPWAAVAPL